LAFVGLDRRRARREQQFLSFRTVPDMKRFDVSRRGPIALACMLALLGLCGCGGADKSGHRAAVKGTVTLDGKPLARGAIKFSPLEGTSGVVTGTPIEDGHFDLPEEIGAAVGWNRVEITAMKKTGKMVPDPFSPGTKVEMETSAVAARFNTDSTLKLEVKPGVNTPPAFAVESK